MQCGDVVPVIRNMYRCLLLRGRGVVATARDDACWIGVTIKR